MSKTTTKRDTARMSRDQESRDANPVHDAPIDFSIQGPLPNIAARPGYAQRWIRVRKGNDPDAQNLFAATRRGWTPRSPSTVSKALQFMTVQHEGFGGCIGTPDMVLMERATELNARERELKRQDRRERESAVKKSLFAEFKGAADAGFSAPSVENESRVERGRAPAIQDD